MTDPVVVAPTDASVNVTLDDLTEDQVAALTPAQVEALQRGARGELPVDVRSPHYGDPASANFVHSMDPDAVERGGVTNTVVEELLTTQTGENGLVVSSGGDIVVDERVLGAGTEANGDYSGEFQPDGANAPDPVGFQSDGSPTEGPADVVEGEGAAAPVDDDES
jgi:hypothetical protein